MVMYAVLVVGCKFCVSYESHYFGTTIFFFAGLKLEKYMDMGEIEWASASTVMCVCVCAFGCAISWNRVYDNDARLSLYILMNLGDALDPRTPHTHTYETQQPNGRQCRIPMGTLLVLHKSVLKFNLDAKNNHTDNIDNERKREIPDSTTILSLFRSLTCSFRIRCTIFGWGKNCASIVCSLVHN